VPDGAFFGWPYAYIGQHEEPRLKGERPDLVAKAVVPSVLIRSHSAPLGIAFYQGAMFPSSYQGNAFVTLHGSWNRAKRTGYKVVRIAFKDGQPAGGYDDFVVGWSPDENGNTVWGRPVGLLVLPDGSLLISDDGAGIEPERVPVVLAGAGGGIGVSNVDARLRATFGERYAH